MHTSQCSAVMINSQICGGEKTSPRQSQIVGDEVFDQQQQPSYIALNGPLLLLVMADVTQNTRKLPMQLLLKDPLQSCNRKWTRHIPDLLS